MTEQLPLPAPTYRPGDLIRFERSLFNIWPAVGKVVQSDPLRVEHAGRVVSVPAGWVTNRIDESATLRKAT